MNRKGGNNRIKGGVVYKRKRMEIHVPSLSYATNSQVNSFIRLTYRYVLGW